MTRSLLAKTILCLSETGLYLRHLICNLQKNNKTKKNSVFDLKKNDVTILIKQGIYLQAHSQWLSQVIITFF
jgi:hypothetical protein